MRLLVAPEINDKMASLSDEAVVSISSLVKFVHASDRNSLLSGGSGFEVRNLDDDVVSLKHGAIRVFASLGSDEEGDYLLLLDLAAETSKAGSARRYFSSRDPRTNIAVNPNRNMSIDPRRNMSIDPRRNMSIDPNRNMSIDPRRNMSIDPRRNMTIDPRRNKFYGGPYVYDTQLNQLGFAVRASDKIELLFDLDAGFNGFVVATAADKVSNVFNTSAQWKGFLIIANENVRLRFDTSGAWVGLIT